MKAVLGLPDDQAPARMMEEGRQKAEKYCQGLCSSLTTPKQRFTKLGDAYRSFADIHVHGIENFYHDEYFKRGNHQNDKQATDMILLAYKSAGSMARVVDHMRQEAYQAPSLISDYLSYESMQSQVDKNLCAAFNVYATKGAAFEPPLVYVRHIACDAVKSITQWLRRGVKPA